MPGQEICVIVIPNDFSEEQNRNGNEAHTTLQETKREDIVQKPNDQTLSHRERHKSNLSSSSTEKHSKEYPCSLCSQSVASRLKYHTIPKLKLHDTVWILTNKNKSFFIICYTELGPQSDGILDELRRAEIGIRSGTQVFIVPISCALGLKKMVNKQRTLDVEESEIDGDNEDKSSNDEANSQLGSFFNRSSSHKFIKSIRARLTIQKLVVSIQSQSSFTFDYLLFCILASLISGLGLLENNTVILVASMLVSPLMGPIIGFLFGLRVQNKKLWVSGLMSECIGILITILTGFLFGLCTTWSETGWGLSESFPTDEMRSRGDYRRLWSGTLVALPSGAAAALSILGGNFGSLIGVAISASLLPPAANAGLLFSYSLLAACRSDIGVHSSIQINQTTTFYSLPSLVNCTTFVNNNYLPLYSCDMSKEAAQLAIYSFILTLINIICICLMAMIILLIKNVIPITSDKDMTQIWRSSTTKAHSGSKNKSHNETNDSMELAQ